MGCSPGNYKCWIGVCGTTADAPGNPSTGGPRLIVSNCPETASPETMKDENGSSTNTLYRCEIELAASTPFNLILRGIAYQLTEPPET